MGKRDDKSGRPARLAERLLDLIERARRAVGEREPADVFLRRYFRERPHLGGTERRLLGDTLFSTFRWHGWLEPLAVLGPETGAALAHLLDAARPHPLVQALLAGSLLADCGWEPLGAFSLAEKAEKLSSWLSGRAAPFVSFRPQAESLVPGWFARALFRPAGADARAHLGRCIEAFQSRPPTWLSAAPHLSEALLDHLRGAGLAAERHPVLGQAISVSGPLDLGPVRRRLRGYFIVQDLASQCVVEACRAAPGQRWWDACAGAGGKSIGLLQRLRKGGSLLATDRRPGVLRQLERRVAEAALHGLSTGIMDAGKNSPAGMRFDGVLVDAPCSGTGTWSRNPDARWRTGESEPAQKAGTQLALLMNAAGSVAAGGVLVYAVCTITRLETVEVVDTFLRENTSFSPEPLPHPLTGEPTDGRIWIWPWQGPGDGMFIARLRRR